MESNHKWLSDRSHRSRRAGRGDGLHKQLLELLDEFGCEQFEGQEGDEFNAGCMRPIEMREAPSEELKERADRAVSVSTIYVTLMRLEEKGFARSWMGEPTGERGGKAKRYFEVRPEGMNVLEATRGARERMWEGLSREAETHAG